MDWKRAMEEEQAALGRIVALLCALAGLAERAAGRSGVVRSLVLWFLRHAETAARDLVAGEPGISSAAMAVGPAGNSPMDAMRLAISLRALARRIDREARRVLCARGRDGDETEPRPAVPIVGAGRPLDAMAALAVAARSARHPAQVPDTS